MAFVDALFPVQNLRLIHGLQKSVQSSTTIVGNSTSEYRIRKTAQYRTSWRYPARLLSATDRRAIALFFTETAQFGLKSFKFKDPELNTYSDTVLTHAMDGKWYLTTPGTSHPIYHLGTDIVVRKNGVVSAYTLDYVGNLPVIHINSASGSDTVTISGTFYHCARFDQSIMSWSMEALGTSNEAFGDNLSDVSLIEVFEH